MLSSIEIVSSSSPAGSNAALLAALISGVDPWTALAAWAIQNGPTGVAFLVIAFLVHKSYIKPAKVRVEALADRADALMENVENFMREQREFVSEQKLNTAFFIEAHHRYGPSIEEITKSLEEMDRQLDAILEVERHGAKEHADIAVQVAEMKAKGDTGNLTDSQLRNLLMVYTGKVMAETYIWWTERVGANGVLSNSQAVRELYSNQKNRIIGKYISQMGMYRYRGVSLDNWCSTGIHVLMEDMFRGLYSRQVAITEGRTGEALDTFGWLQHRVSLIQGSADAWINNLTKLDEYLTHHPLDGTSSIDWLQGNIL